MILTNTNNKTMLTEKAYDIGKKAAQIWIPALSSLYFGLGNIWGFPSIEQVIGSAAVIDTFLGVILGISTKNYDASGAAHDGEMIVDQTNEGKIVYQMNLNDDPVALKDKDSVSFKVVPPTGPVPPIV